MNTSSCARPPAPPAPARAPDAARRMDSPEHSQQGQQFERMLRDKARANDKRDDADTDTSTSSDAPAGASATSFAMFAALPTMHQSPTQVSAPPPQQGQSSALESGAEAPSGPSQPETSASQAALQSSLNADPAPAPLGASSAQAAGTWEVSVNQPLGAALQMSATRPERANNAEGPAAWTLTIGSSNVDASVLARHAPRLNERLRARSLTNTHVRIEESQGGQEQEPS